MQPALSRGDHDIRVPDRAGFNGATVTLFADEVEPDAGAGRPSAGARSSNFIRTAKAGFSSRSGRVET